MRILLVEDDVMIGQEVERALRSVNYTVDWFKSGNAADTALQTADYDAVLLDLGLPDSDGLNLLRQLRRRKQAVPVMVVTAREAVGDRIAGLDAGADDYVLKPFDIDELLARLRALIRRAAGLASTLFESGNVRIDISAKQVVVSGKTVPLSAREWAVLEPLVLRPGIVQSRAQLEEKLYGWQDEISSNAVEVHIHNLRRKLGTGFIRNIRGVGYVVNPA
ncbi:MAG: response regulator [Burkholderiaceae bacterium]